MFVKPVSEINFYVSFRESRYCRYPWYFLAPWFFDASIFSRSIQEPSWTHQHLLGKLGICMEQTVLESDDTEVGGFPPIGQQPASSHQLFVGSTLRSLYNKRLGPVQELHEWGRFARFTRPWSSQRPIRRAPPVWWPYHWRNWWLCLSSTPMTSHHGNTS